jgi:hypothetical protein
LLCNQFFQLEQVHVSTEAGVVEWPLMTSSLKKEVAKKLAIKSSLMSLKYNKAVRAKPLRKTRSVFVVSF